MVCPLETVEFAGLHAKVAGVGDGVADGVGVGVGDGEGLGVGVGEGVATTPQAAGVRLMLVSITKFVPVAVGL